MSVAYVGLGANLGDARNTLQRALISLGALPQTTLLASSSLYRTAPVDAQGPDYINAVAKVDTKLTAHDLLKALQNIEQYHGRTRAYRNAPRTLDLDILLFGDQTINDDDLIVPHPRMHERAFVLQPLAELQPDMTLSQGSLAHLIARCADQRVSLMP